MINYIRDHWSGRQPLTQTLLLNCLTPFIITLLVQQQLLEPLLVKHNHLRLPLLGLLTTVYAAVLLSAFVSVNRKVRGQTAQTYGEQNQLLLSNIVVFVCSCMALVNILDFRTHAIETQTHIKLAFTPIDLQLENPTRLRVSGKITPSSPRQLNEFLESAPQVTTLVLDSTGGDIYAARAIAITIKSRALNTHVINQCFSACTVIYASGKSRTAATGARFGFHSYQYQLAAEALYGSVLEQQKKDAALFRSQGVAPQFINKMFAAPPEQLWTPQLSELIDAKLVHAPSP